MDKLRKIGQWVWLNKERMVFLIMVIILCWRVYKVVTPVEAPPIPPYPPVSSQGQMEVPTPPPAPDRITTPPPTAPLTRNDPFWFYGSSETGGGGDEEEGANIILEGIQETPKGPVARLRTKGGRARPYWQDEQFENYIIRSIDAAAGTVEIYDESQGETIVLQVQ